VNAVFLPMILLAGVFYDEKTAPAVLRDIAQVLPLTHLVDGLSGAMVKGQGLGSHGVALLVLALWAIGALVVAVRGFSWEARRA
jgi:ABC-2 type transport system permease protein